MSGILYVVGTPIGNLEDVTLRALRVLREAGTIACEDTRHTRKLLERHAIRSRLVSYHKFNERARVTELLGCLGRGENVALVTDAGTPAVSDPGAILVTEAAAAGYPVVPVPGPSALATAVSAAGLAGSRLTFLGFLPSRAAARRRLLTSLDGVEGLLVFYESPRRAAAALRDLVGCWPERRAIMAREMTKMHEEIRRGTLADLAASTEDGVLRGEITFVVEGASRATTAKRCGGKSGREASLEIDAAGLKRLRREVERRVRETGKRRPAAMREVAREKGVDSRALYRLLAGRGKGARGAD